MKANSPAVCPLTMHAPAPLSFWRQLPAIRRRHLLMAAAGTLISWLLAALMACTTTVAPVALYKRLGGEDGIELVVSRTLDRVAANPSSAHSFDGVRMSFLKRNVSAYVCKVADGPCAYEGETMAHAHAQSQILDHEFDFMVSVMREELDRANVATGAKNELLRRLAPSKRDIVLR
jgi:hemoglobin